MRWREWFLAWTTSTSARLICRSYTPRASSPSPTTPNPSTAHVQPNNTPSTHSSSTSPNAASTNPSSSMSHLPDPTSTTAPWTRQRQQSATLTSIQLTYSRYITCSPSAPMWLKYQTPQADWATRWRSSSGTLGKVIRWRSWRDTCPRWIGILLTFVIAWQSLK